MYSIRTTANNNVLYPLNLLRKAISSVLTTHTHTHGKFQI